ncbi:class F sortase [Thermobispora bispora]|uniref:Peptidase C60 sortase A and B n=1 Tax=Thermobispora bispora (strain ATCC 19993 / DSM 43833 / CBS 139.67 / JCM 10125 / KCTC 9307 / NBRC 14880 / R51) TaxID=469371 RepID=D6Y4Y2_THEBD|nr:class F sortase [Thermobispora bispora]ADG87257.1 peptidase C60 sortase A and B [Thermobispora bispora DSM 43833]QSI47208.1 class F sortase [Thermobispora bispora]
MTMPPAGQYPPGPPHGAPIDPNLPAGPPPVLQPVVLPPVVPQAPVPPEPEPVAGSASLALRGVLLFAAVAGIITVIIGVISVVSSPEEYAAPDRSTIRLQREEPGGLAPSVGPGGPGEPLTQAAATAPPPVPAEPPAAPLQPATPKRLIIPKLGVDAPIISVGTDRNGELESPPMDEPNLVGWYRGGPTPGQAGPAVLLGHKDTRTRSAVFSRLHELRYGDRIEVVRMDGTVAVFTVGGVEQASKDTFPTERVYGRTEYAELRLITCGGVYNRVSGHYLDNVIVYARMTATERVDRAS